jgi:hypothetical protein
MASDGQSVERLRDYLRTLNPEARAMLTSELERSLLSGEEDAGSELVLNELRRAMRAESLPVKRIGDAARLFFAPLEPFLIDAAADHARLGRVARISLLPLWDWLTRELMPAEAKSLCDDINRAVLDGDHAKAAELTRALHKRAIVRIGEAIAAVEGDERARWRLGSQVGTPRALQDLDTLLVVLSGRDVLADLATRLPDRIRVLDRDRIKEIKTLLDAAASARKSDVVLYGLLLVLNRLAAPWQLIRIATFAAQSDDTARISETAFSKAVTLVLREVEGQVDELRTELKARRPVTSLLKAIHDAARGLRTEIDLSSDSPWSRQLTAIRAEVSKVLKAEIEAAPGRVRQLLRPRPVGEIAANARLDEHDVAEAEMLVEFVGACRNYAGELAVNEATMRSYSDLQTYLEVGTKVLLDSLRQAGDSDRPFRQSQVEAAIRFCKAVFGAEYAGLLAKAAGVAAQSSPDRAAEPQAARA